MISVNPPAIGADEEALVLEVLRSGRLVKGPMVERFEDAVRAEVGTKHAISVNSGTSALVSSLLAHGIRPDDEVITSPFTFVATLNAILHAGARPRFVDIGDDFNMDSDQVGSAVTPATKALLPVHLYGLPADIPRMTSEVGRDLAVVEDAAQALGATIGGRAAGSFGTGCFSFYATKNVTTGEGGVVTTDDDAVADAVRLLRDQGQRSTYEYARPGFNFRMSELQAALGVAQMARLQELNAARNAHAAVLSDALAGLEGLVLPEVPPGRTHVFHQYTVRVTADARVSRDEVHDALATLGIGSGIYYPRPVFEYECFRADPRIGSPNTPRAERFAREVLSLPVHPALRASELEHIIDGVRRCLG